MAISFSSVAITGNLTRDIELKIIGDLQIANFSVAVNERKKKNNEWVDHPVYIDCTVFGKMAEYASKTIGKGSLVSLTGRLDLQTWEKDGERKSKHSVNVDKLSCMSAAPAGGQPTSSSPPSSSRPSYSQPSRSAPMEEEDIPF